MNFFEYVGVTSSKFETDYIDAGLVQRQRHKEFPLDIFAYTRKAVHDNVWDGVTSKCRGIIVHRETGEVIARPFEKFHNFGSSAVNGTDPVSNPKLFEFQPTIWEKVDGFMCTFYRWEGQPYIASKGSFHSIHAKWATAWYRENVIDLWPEGFTPVFEGLHPDLRIVVDYKDRIGLVLLALINIETGEELSPGMLQKLGEENKVETPKLIDMTWQRANEESFKRYSDALGTDEGYVLTWYMKHAPPIRLKMKFAEYLRLHRIVTGISPKRIWETLSNGEHEELDEWLNSSTPWFASFAKKWMDALSERYKNLQDGAGVAYSHANQVVKKAVLDDITEGKFDPAAIRKAYATIFTAGENKKYSPILFSMLDGKPIQPVIWKQVKAMTANSKPLIDAHST